MPTMATAGLPTCQPSTIRHSTKTGMEGESTEADAVGDVSHIISSAPYRHDYHCHRCHRRHHQRHPTTWPHLRHREAVTTDGPVITPLGLGWPGHLSCQIQRDLRIHHT